MSSNLPPNLTTHQPLIHNPLKTDNEEGLITPGVAEFIVTETTFLKIATESLVPLVTES